MQFECHWSFPQNVKKCEILLMQMQLATVGQSDRCEHYQQINSASPESSDIGKDSQQLSALDSYILNVSRCSTSVFKNSSKPEHLKQTLIRHTSDRKSRGKVFLCFWEGVHNLEVMVQCGPTSQGLAEANERQYQRSGLVINGCGIWVAGKRT